MPVDGIGNGGALPPQNANSSSPRPGDAAEQNGSTRTGHQSSNEKNAGVVHEKPSANEQREIQKLKQSDRRVRAHEMAHIAAGGRYIRKAASYSYQTGPDGKRYAVGGEVSIDLSAESTPEATMQKMKVVRAAALAPAQPSSQDYAVANKASQKAATASMEKAQEVRDKVNESSGDKTSEPKSTSGISEEKENNAPKIVTDGSEKSSPASKSARQANSNSRIISQAYSESSSKESRDDRAGTKINTIG